MSNQREKPEQAEYKEALEIKKFWVWASCSSEVSSRVWNRAEGTHNAQPNSAGSDHGEHHGQSQDPAGRYILQKQSERKRISKGEC